VAGTGPSLSLNSARCTLTTVAVGQNQLMSTFDSYRVPGLSTKPWHDMVRALGRPPVMDAIVRANNFSNPLGTNLVHSWTNGLGREPAWMDTVRAVNKPVWADHFAGTSTSALVRSFHRNLLPTYPRFDVGAKVAIQSMDLGVKLAPVLTAIDILRPSTAIIASIVKDFERGWAPPHQLIPGLTGGVLPGFDPAIRSILEQISAEFGIDVEVPDDEIEFTAWPDVELQSDIEYIDYTNGHGQELDSAFLPRRLLMQAVRNIVFILLVCSLADEASPSIVGSLPAAVSEQLPEDVVPDQFDLPDWLTKTVLLGYALRAARKDTSDPDR